MGQILNFGPEFFKNNIFGKQLRSAASPENFVDQRSETKK